MPRWTAEQLGPWSTAVLNIKSLPIKCDPGSAVANFRFQKNKRFERADTFLCLFADYRWSGTENSRSIRIFILLKSAIRDSGHTWLELTLEIAVDQGPCWTVNSGVERRGSLEGVLAILNLWCFRGVVKLPKKLMTYCVNRAPKLRRCYTDLDVSSFSH